jgi:lipid-A-disaccharide synthase
MSETPCFFVVACEPSGDILGSRIMRSIRERLKGKVRFEGVGGERMEAEGMQSLFPQSDLALFGITELVPKIPHVLKRIDQTAKAVKEIRPKAVITIDGPDFSFRVAKKLKGCGIPLIHDVAPSVWAWRAGRAKKIAKLYNHLLALLPFEPSYFIEEGLSTTFTGHPVIERVADLEAAERFRKRHNIAPDRKILCILPGSRKSEIERLAPIFGEALGLLKKKLGDAFIVMPSLPEVLPYLKPHIPKWPVKPVVLLGEEDKYDAFRASHAALAASGTVSLELAMAEVPHVVAYRLNTLTVMIYRSLVKKIKFFNLVNILLDKAIIPEYMQFNCTPQKLARALWTVWSDKSKREVQLTAFQRVRKLLQSGKVMPSEKAAKVICEVAGVQS